MQRLRRQVKRVATAIIGGFVVVVGIIAIPYPGPGWLIVFAGLALLGTEFDWAQRALRYLKEKYDAYEAWIIHQPPGVQALTGLFTLIIVVATVWLVNGYGFLNDWLNLGQDWLRSPIPWFYPER